MTMNQRFEQYRTILSQKPQHEKALQECFAALKGPDDYDRLFLHVFAPAAVEFTEWVLKQAIKDGKKRLYFLARDGWLFYQLALQLVKKFDYSIEIRYLKVSRYSMRSAGYHLMGADSLDLICAGGIDCTFEKIMKRAALTEAEAFEIARLAGYETGYRQILNYKMLQKLKEKLKHIPLFLQYVNTHAKSCYDAAVSYLIQEGLREDIPYAIVDSGWIGTLQQSIGLLVRKSVTGYYFGLYEIPKGEDDRHYRACYFMPDGQLRRKVFFSNCLFEAVFSSPEGMTIGYEMVNPPSGKPSVCKPMESERGNPNADKMRRNAKLLSGYLDAYGNTSAAIQNETEEEASAMIYHLFRKLMGKPEAFEAEILGNFMFCDDVLEAKLQPTAAAFTAEELKKRRFINRILIKLNIQKKVLHESAWPEAGIVLYGRHVRYHLLWERLYKYFMYVRKAVNAK